MSTEGQGAGFRRLVAPWAIAVTLAALPAWAQAQAVEATANGPVQSVLQLRDIFAAITAGIEHFAAGHDGLVAIGRRTAVVLAAVLLVWGVIRSWILGQGIAQLLPGFLQPVIILGLALWAVDHLGPTVRASVAALGDVLAGALFLSGGPPSEVDIIDRMAMAAFDVVSAAPKEAGSSWTNVPSAVAHQAVAFLYRLFAALVLMLAGAIAAGVMLMAKVQTALAILFAPVLIPWGMWQPTAFLFHAWLGFLISGAMQSVMALAIASMSVQVIDRLVVIAKSMGSTDGMSFVTCCVLLLVAMLVGFLFVRVPSLAASLVGTGSGLNLERWSAVGTGAGKGLSTVGGAVSGSAGGMFRAGRDFVERVAPARAPAAGRTLTHGGASFPRPASATGSHRAAARSNPQAGTRPFPTAVMEGGAATPAAHAKAPHRPFRPKPGARPVNRPIRDPLP